MLDILLVHPPITDFSKKFALNSLFYELQLEPPLGICYIGAVLEQAQFKVRILDMDILKYTEKNLEDLIRYFKPKVVGFSVNSLNYTLALAYSKMIKASNNEMKIIFGGIHASLKSSEVIKEDSIDFVVYGEGEYTTKELMEILLRNKGDLTQIRGLIYKDQAKHIKINDPRPEELNLDHFPFPARHLLLGNANHQYFSAIAKSKHIATLMTSRGCPYNCTFCSKLFQKPRFRSAQNMIEELQEIEHKFNIKDIQIMDETFNLKPKNNLEFCHLIQKEHLDIQWRGRCRPDLMTKEMIQEFARSNCYILTYGAESGSPRILRFLKKQYTVEQIKAAFKWTDNANIETHALFMIGIPGETTQDIQRTNQLIKDLHPNYLQMSTYVALPGTVLYDLVLKHKLYDPIPWNYLLCPRDQIYRVKLPNLPYPSISKLTKLTYSNYVVNLQFIKKMFKIVIENPIRYPMQLATLLSYVLK